MLFIELINHTHLMLQYLSLYDVGSLRQTSWVLKQWVETHMCPTGGTWADTCRFCDRQMMWKIGGMWASCYKPVRAQWVIAYWQKKLPSIIPPPFWNYFMRMMKGFVSMSHFLQWSAFEQRPLIVSPCQKKWGLGMKVAIVGTSTHDAEHYPEELKNIDEFIAVGATLHQTTHIQESILGLNAHSIGWHSDDGNIYVDSLVVDEGEPFGQGDEVEIIVDYSYGLLLCKKNGRFIYLHELTGEMLSNPLTLGATCRTMNSLFFSIV